MKSGYRILLCTAFAATVALASGCRKSELEKDGVIRSSWGVTIIDGPAGGHPPEILAYANFKLLEELIPKSGLQPKTEILLVPELSGYRTFVLAKHRVSDSEKKLIDDLVATAFRSSYEDWAEFKKKANQSAEPMPPGRHGSP